VTAVFDGGNQVVFIVDSVAEGAKTLAQTGWSSSAAWLQVAGSEDITRFDGMMSFFRLSTRRRAALPFASFAAIKNEPSIAAGDQVDAPATGSPDLVVLGLDTYPSAQGGLIVQAVGQNQGDLSTENGFHTDLYVDPAQVTTPARFSSG
jgi:hypothetical protein